MTRAREQSKLSTAIDADNYSGQNLIINGKMAVAQRGTESASTGYIIDRWKYIRSNGGAATQRRAIDFPPMSSASQRSKYCYELEVTTADTTSSHEYLAVLYTFEYADTSHLGFGQTGHSNNVTLSFWHKHTQAGTNYVAVSNQDVSRSYVAAYTQTVADTWEKAEVTIPVDTGGSWGSSDGTDAGKSIVVKFAIDLGTNWETATVDAWQDGDYYHASDATHHMATVGNRFRFTMVQFELGSRATEFEDEAYATTLLKCQRYYQKFRTLGSFGNVTASSTPGFITHMFNPRMRIPDPTVNVVNWSASNFPNTPVSVVIGHDRIQIQSNASNTGYGGWFGYDVTADAEIE